MSAIKAMVRYHKLNISILLFLLLFTFIHYTKPTLLYDTNGGFREFGVGYRNKTVVPIWLVAIFLSILCYLAVAYYLAHF
jgi:hypothetical protein